MSKKLSAKQYERAMDVDEAVASKKQLRRKIKALYQLADDYSAIEEKDAIELAVAHEAIGDLLVHLLDYAEDLDKADADIDAVIETAAEETRNYSKALRESKSESDHYKAQVDRLLELGAELRNIAKDALQQRDDVMKDWAGGILDGKDLIDGKTITEWYGIAKDWEKKYNELAVSDKNIG